MRTRTTHRTTSVLFAGLLAAGIAFTAACGSADSSAGDGGPTTVAPSAPGQTSDSAGQTSGASQAVRVSYRKTGGMRAVDETVTYAAGSPPPSGSSQADVRAILGAASDPELRTIDMTPLPKNPCCDLQEYTVLITYADGSTTSFRTVDGVQQPPVFEDLLSMLG